MKIFFGIFTLFFYINCSAQWDDFCYFSQTEVIDVFKRNFLAEVQKKSFETVSKNKVKKVACLFEDIKQKFIEVEFDSDGRPLKYSQFKIKVEYDSEGKSIQSSPSYKQDTIVSVKCEFSKDGRVLSLDMKTPETDAIARYKYNSKGRITDIAFENNGNVYTRTLFEYDKTDTIIIKAVNKRKVEDITETFKYEYSNYGTLILSDNEIFGNGKIANYGNQIEFVGEFDKVSLTLLSEQKIAYRMFFSLDKYSDDKFYEIKEEIEKNGFFSNRLNELVKGGDHFGMKIVYDERGLPSGGFVVSPNFKSIKTEYVYEYYD